MTTLEPNIKSNVAHLTLLTLVFTLSLTGDPAQALLKKGADEEKQARQFESKGNHASAIKYWDLAIAKNPDALRWRQARAQAYMELHDYKKALQDWDALLKCEANNILALQERAHCFAFMGDNNKAIEACDAVFKYNVEDGGLRQMRAQCYEKIGKHKEAAADYKLLENQGFTEDTWKAIAAAHSEKAHQNPAWAANVLRRQIKFAPTCPYLYLECCNLFVLNDISHQGEFNELALKAASLSPPGSGSWREGHLFAAKDYIMRSQSAEAIKEFTVALTGINVSGDKKRIVALITSDDLDQALHGRAQAWSTLSNFEKAIEDETALINNHWQNAEYFVSRSRYYRSNHQLEKSLEDIIHATQLAPDDTSISLQLLRLYEEMKKYDPAVSLVTALLKVGKNDEFLYSERANLYIQLEQYDKAIADLSKLIELSPDEVRFYEQRALAYRKTGKTALAEADEKQWRKLK